ncbi:excinuclease ABC subunit UvrC [Rhodovibrionaceae bacterium A322]
MTNDKKRSRPRKKNTRQDPTAGGKRAPNRPEDFAAHYETAEPRLFALKEPASSFSSTNHPTSGSGSGSEQAGEGERAPSKAPNEASANEVGTDGVEQGAPKKLLGSDDTPQESAAQQQQESETTDQDDSSLSRGLEVLNKTIKTLPGGPGVYRMLNRKGDVLYVGKAKNLKRRVTSYTQVPKLPRRLQRMVSETLQMEIITTKSEVEALLLESNMIKRFMPRYNVLLRDDKSFPYILITGDHDYPQVTKHRGAQKRPGKYFGPFASAGAVNRTITALEKAFLLRNCSDAIFNQRTRPCLQYQIKRCSAPCVARISHGGYQELVKEANDFLTGRSSQVQAQLATSMQQASEDLDFETAARLRDRIRALAHIQSHQDINVEGVEDADVIAAHQEGGQSCIQVFFFRAGRNYGNRAYFPSHDKQLAIDEVLAAFVAQFYDNKPVPRTILVSHDLPEQTLITEALELRAERKVQLQHPKRGAKRKLITAALENAREALARRLAESSAQRRLLEGLGDLLGLDSAPLRVEVYDNSHTQGTDAYGGMIVAGPEGFTKNAYRKFSIKNKPTAETQAIHARLAEQDNEELERKPKDMVARGGDDYAMMREVLTRRLSRAQKEDPDRESGTWPDLLMLDGGRGQLTIGLEVLADLGLEDIPIVAVAKGPDRDAGRERIFLPGRAPLLLPPQDPVLYFIQRLRDEAHRFAIGTHRAGRSKSRLVSSLDGIDGIGAKRKKALLLHFGSAKQVERAALSDLEKVEGISKTVAQKIFDHYNDRS